MLGIVGLLLLVLSVAVADQLARSLIRPIRALAQASDRLAAGDLSARATVAGPHEVCRAGTGLNRLAVRIGELLRHERETVADLSHRLRTPLTALRIDAESLRDPGEMERLLADVSAVERTVSGIIREARRPGGDGSEGACDAVEVIAARSAFWWPLAEGAAFAVRLSRRAGAARGWSSRTTALASVTSTPRSGGCRWAVPPGSAWTSRGGSPRLRAAR